MNQVSFFDGSEKFTFNSELHCRLLPYVRKEVRRNQKGEKMNNITLIGRLTKDPEMRYIPEKEMAVATFTLAIDRGKDKGADFPRITVFGKQAENCEKYLTKGRLVAIQGRIQTGSYKNKDGATVYTTDVIADRVEFLEWGEKKTEPAEAEPDFQQLDDDSIPF